MNLSLVARAPGRVNLIGDHTDYTGGHCLPMAINLEATATFVPLAGTDTLQVRSDLEPSEAMLPSRLQADHAGLANIEPAWARYVAAIAALTHPGAEGVLSICSNLPAGAGLSSSAAVEVATALAIGSELEPLALALACQRAEKLASGVPCGMMDQLVIAAGVEGAALLIDCGALTWETVPLPAGVEIVVADSGQPRRLASSAYAERVSECERAERVVGPLARVTVADLRAIDDLRLRRRARHVVTENARVLAMAGALLSGDIDTAGALMNESHASLAQDFEVSTAALDELVSSLRALSGVRGARLTGAGFGGCAVALVERGTRLPAGIAPRVWHVRASQGATVAVSSEPVQ